MPQFKVSRYTARNEGLTRVIEAVDACHAILALYPKEDVYPGNLGKSAATAKWDDSGCLCYPYIQADEMETPMTTEDIETFEKDRKQLVEELKEANKDILDLLADRTSLRDQLVGYEDLKVRHNDLTKELAAVRKSWRSLEDEAIAHIEIDRRYSKEEYEAVKTDMAHWRCEYEETKRNYNNLLESHTNLSEQTESLKSELAEVVHKLQERQMPGVNQDVVFVQKETIKDVIRHIVSTNRDAALDELLDMLSAPPKPDDDGIPF